MRERRSAALGALSTLERVIPQAALATLALILVLATWLWRSEPRLWVRRLGYIALAAVIFVAWRLGWMATALYVPCLAIHASSGGQIDLRLMIVIAGILLVFVPLAVNRYRRAAG